jgi:hypothetical protein
MRTRAAARLRILGGRIDGDHPADRMADETRAPDLERFEDCDQVVAITELDVLGFRPPEPADVVADRP